jgi:Zn-finger nucleic acid-binding protein
MPDEKDRFGEKLRLLEKAREDIYFAAKDRALIEKLKTALQKSPSGETSVQLKCPKCRGEWAAYTFRDIALDRCESCGGVWFDRGEIDALVGKFARGGFRGLVRSLLGETQRPEER